MGSDAFTRYVHNWKPELNVLCLTNYADRLFEPKQPLWAAEAYLETPFARESLRKAVALQLFGRTTV
jgi:hypothetical protein